MMKVSRIWFLLFLNLVVALCSAAQEIDEDSNWFKEIGRKYYGYSEFDFTRYTKNEIQSAKSKYLQIESDPSLDEWEGLYTRETMLGRAELMWSDRHGFVYTYVYHKLANMDYGKITLLGNSILLKSERGPARRSSSFIKGEHVKVKFGERHLLVEKNMLKDFALFAAGVDVPDRRDNGVLFTEDGGAWEKVGDEEKQLAEVPVFPALYAHLIRRPIKSTVLSVGPLRLKRAESTTSNPKDDVDHLRSITLSTGSLQGVRAGMTFWIDDLEERVEVVSVRRNEAVALLLRLMIDGEEFCRNNEHPNGERFQCRVPKPGMTARTKTRYF